ncbi:GlxA family transcriptional regulator [Pseudomonas sp. G.S.17]|uniref:GlxA family transcriptional regulator n=1 Tax=Pseudomonas sp. G.S.17 TaxID=3137451 RepID=UPI00311CC2A3
MSKTRTIAILAVPGVQLLDVSGPLDVFAEANAQSGREYYQLQIWALEAGPVRSSSGARLLPDHVVGDGLTEVDTLLVAGAPNAPYLILKPSIIRWLQDSALRARRYGSVCTGAFVLAAAGLLEGKHVTTHWMRSALLAERYPDICVEEDALHVHDGKVHTAAGVTAGLDMALALVEDDLGRDIAKQVASQLVMYFKRPGGQLQFSRRGESLPTGRAMLQELQRWIAANPADDHSISRLAERVNLSPRHFARLFHAEVGITPAAWVEQARVAAARKQLESGVDVPKQVAAQCGFANADTLRRTFTRHVGVTPSEYRKRFVRAL